MKKLKVLAINVSLRPYKPQIIFPIGLSYVVGAISRAGYDLELLDLDRNRKTDEELREILSNKDFDVAVFGCIVTGYKIIKKLSKLIREVKKDVVMVAGNSVADSIPHVLLSKTEVDVAVIGEGEVTIVEVLDRLENKGGLDGVKGIWFKKDGKIIENPLRELIRDINTIPFPAWDLFDMEAYIAGMKDLINEPAPLSKDKLRAFMVNIARGCPFKCSFCYQVFRRSGYRHRSVDAVFKEIKELQRHFNINYIPLWDELSFPTKNHLREFVDRIFQDGLKFFWTADCRSDLFDSEDDIELLKRTKESGCIGFGYSLESANVEILKTMNKKLLPKDFARQKRLLDKAGLITWTSLVFGYPEETKETIKQTMDLCYELDIYPSSGYLLPMPGTPMYDYVLQNGIIKDEEEYLLSLGDRQDLRLNLTKMSDDEFQSEIKMHLKRISEKLNLDMGDQDLLKTTTYKNIAKLIKT